MQRRTTITLALAALLGAAVFVPDGASAQKRGGMGGGAMGAGGGGHAAGAPAGGSAQIGGGTSGPTGAGASHS